MASVRSVEGEKEQACVCSVYEVSSNVTLQSVCSVYLSVKVFYNSGTGSGLAQTLGHIERYSDSLTLYQPHKRMVPCVQFKTKINATH